MEQGPIEAKIIQECMRQRFPLPQRMQNAPELGVGLELFYNGFHDLSTCRSLGFGAMSGIPWTAVSEYCDQLGLSPDLRDDMHHHVRSMDETYLAFVNKKGAGK